VFIGHFGAGLAGKRAAPRLSLGWLFLGAQFLDLLWPTLLLLGVERVAIVPGATAVTPLEFEHYPFSHSLVAVAVWAALLGGAYLALHRGARREAAVLALLVLSHWLLDALVHEPDLALTPFGAGPLVGLGLWNSMAATLLVEIPIFVVGVGLYARCTRARDTAGRIGLWALVAFLAAIHAANLLGPPPPSVTAIAWIGHAQWLIVVLGFWLDRHRVAARA
jgi:membrane-bound metal-dependent hydrolase YbcI (DUF457 family)